MGCNRIALIFPVINLFHLLESIIKCPKKAIWLIYSGTKLVWREYFKTEKIDVFYGYVALIFTLLKLIIQIDIITDYHLKEVWLL